MSAPLTAHMSNFDPIPRLQQIAATIEDGGHFDSPATAAHYINCAIKEIETIRKDRDEMQGELRKAETECSMLRVECGVLEKNAEMTYENHKRIVKELTTERDEARRECRLLLLGQEVLRGVRDLPAPPDDLVTIVPVPRKEDGK